MDKIKFYSNSLLLPLCVVVATSLPYYIILRLYPTILNFSNYVESTNLIFATWFFAAVFFGSSLAFLMNDFFIGSVYTTLGALAAECLALIIILALNELSSRTAIYISLLFLGFVMGILHTCITAFFGDRHTDELFYGRLKHFHFYLLGHFVAYIISIGLTPLYFPIEYYGICFSTSGLTGSLAIAIVCVGLALIGLILQVFTFGTLQNSKSESNVIPAIFSRMKLALIIFIPFLFLWILTFLTEQFWFVQGQNMYTKLQQYHLELIRAAIIILSIPVAFLFTLKGNEFVRMAIGGIFIIVAMFYSMFLGNFNAEPHRNITRPGFTELYLINAAEAFAHVRISELEMIAGAHQLVGPFYIKTPLLKKPTKVISDNRGVLTFDNGFPESRAIVVLNLKTHKADDYFTSDVRRYSDRTYRSFSSFPLLRVFSYTAAATWQDNYIQIVGGEPFIEYNITLTNGNIMEIPPGEYVIGNSDINRTYYLRSGGFYDVVFINMYCKDDFGTTIWSEWLTIIKRIDGYGLSIYYQTIQYILLSLGKILIISSGLSISYALADRNMKGSIIGIFWGIYYLARLIFYAKHNFLMDTFLNNIPSLYICTTTSVIAFYFLYYFMAYKMTDIMLTLDDNESLSDEEQGNRQPVKKKKVKVAEKT